MNMLQKKIEITTLLTGRELCKSLALTYYRGRDTLKDISQNSIVIEELNEYINSEYDKIKNIVKMYDSEVTCNQMISMYTLDGIIGVSTLHNNSKLLGIEQNLKFRAIHDYIHISSGFLCDLRGEYQTYLAQSNDLSQACKFILFSEIVLQAAYFVYFGKFADNQKVVLIPELPLIETMKDILGIF